MSDTTHDPNGHPAASGLFWLAAPDDADRADFRGLRLAAAAIGTPVAATVVWGLLGGSGVQPTSQPSTVVLAAVVLLASVGALYSGWMIAAAIAD